MAQLTPGQLKQRIAAITDDLDKLLDDYEWLYKAAYGTSGRRSDRRASGVSRPTETAAITDPQREGWRNRLKEASELLEDAEKMITRAAGRARVTYRARDALNLANPPGSRATTRTELQSLMDAQKRRQSRRDPMEAS